MAFEFVHVDPFPTREATVGKEGEDFLRRIRIQRSRVPKDAFPFARAYAFQVEEDIVSCWKKARSVDESEASEPSASFLRVLRFDRRSDVPSSYGKIASVPRSHGEKALVFLSQHRVEEQRIIRRIVVVSSTLSIPNEMRSSDRSIRSGNEGRPIPIERKDPSGSKGEFGSFRKGSKTSDGREREGPGGCYVHRDVEDVDLDRSGDDLDGDGHEGVDGSSLVGRGGTFKAVSKSEHDHERERRMADAKAVAKVRMVCRIRKNVNATRGTGVLPRGMRRRSDRSFADGS